MNDSIASTPEAQPNSPAGLGQEYRYRLLRLNAWPNLPQLQDDLIPLVARVCALLACKPTTASLIPLVLNVPEDKVYAVIKVLAESQHVEILGAGQPPSAEAVRQNAAQVAELEAGKKQISSIIGHLWQRLLVRS